MKHQIVNAVEKLACLKYFPGEPGARQAVMELFARMVAAPEQLEWLVRTLIDRVGEWPGPREVRGVFCSRFKPADGVEEFSTIGSFSAEANEALSISESNGLKSGLLTGKSDRLRLQAPEYDRVPAAEMQAYRERIKRLCESTSFPEVINGKSLGQEEQEVAELVAKPTLTAEETARRLADLQAALGMQ